MADRKMADRKMKDRKMKDRKMTDRKMSSIFLSGQFSFSCLSFSCLSFSCQPFSCQPFFRLVNFPCHPRDRYRGCGEDRDAHAFVRPARQWKIRGAGFHVKQRGGAECIA